MSFVKRLIESAARKHIREAAEKIGKFAAAKFYVPTGAWLAKPNIRYRLDDRKNEVVIYITPTWKPDDPDSWYYWTLFGTKEYQIRAREGHALKIRGFRPKTFPGSLRSATGGHSGVTGYRGAVRHATQARYWNKIVARDIVRYYNEISKKSYWPFSVSVK